MGCWALSYCGGTEDRLGEREGAAEKVESSRGEMTPGLLELLEFAFELLCQRGLVSLNPVRAGEKIGPHLFAHPPSARFSAGPMEQAQRVSPGPSSLRARFLPPPLVVLAAADTIVSLKPTFLQSNSVNDGCGLEDLTEADSLYSSKIRREVLAGAFNVYQRIII